MTSPISATLSRLVDSLRRNEAIASIGLSSSPLPTQKGEGDIDLFIYCRNLPAPAGRTEFILPELRTLPLFRPAVYDSPIWGSTDYVEIAGVETWLMYFTVAAARAEFESIISGQTIDRLNGYYPTGRLAMYRNMTILHDDGGLLAGFKARLAVYPPALKACLIEKCLAEVNDEEDLLRAVTRGDVLFFHAAIDSAVDSLLQLTFAVNECLFPGRKRNRQHLETFARAPQDMYPRIQQILFLGTRPACLQSAFEQFQLLRDELIRLHLTP